MKGKVLLVDDSALARRAVRQILESEGYVVVEADDGMVALERYFLEKPDIVLLDLVMKGIGGLDVLGKLRQMDPAARVVVVSADIQDSSRQMAHDSGACAFVNKPVSRTEIVNVVAGVLSLGE